MASLIEGLPDDLAMRCLALVPLGMHRTMRAVCKTWGSALCSGQIFKLRREAGLVEEWLYVTSYEPDHPWEWEAYDPLLDQWFKLPAFPCPMKLLQNFGTAAVGGRLFVIGGRSSDVDPTTGEREYKMATNTVWCFSPVGGKWEQKASMLVARSLFACCAVDGKIIAAGGFSNSRRPLTTAEMYDPVEDEWKPIAELNFCFNSPGSAVVLDGKMHLVHKGKLREVYDPKTNNWNCFSSLSAWKTQGPMAVVKGKLYTVACHCKWCSAYGYRNGFVVAGIGSDLYVVGGMRPGRLGLRPMKEVSIWNVENKERRGTSTTLGGIVQACAVLGL